jgi:hypothetical protein
LAPGVLEEMEKLCPRDENGSKKSKLHQYLTDDFGIPKLKEHFISLITLQKASDDWDHFCKLADKILPKRDISEFDVLLPPKKSKEIEVKENGI